MNYRAGVETSNVSSLVSAARRRDRFMIHWDLTRHKRLDKEG